MTIEDINQLEVDKDYISLDIEGNYYRFTFKGINQRNNDRMDVVVHGTEYLQSVDFSLNKWIEPYSIRLSEAIYELNNTKRKIENLNRAIEAFKLK